MRRLLIALTIFLSLSAVAHAQTHVVVPARGNGCYRTDEAEAEQAIRIHSELMVIGLDCQAIPRYNTDGQNLYAKYRIWTAKHGKLIAEYEGRLIGYFLRQGYPDPEAAFNTMRTEFANKVASDAAHMRPDIFCSQFAPRIDRVSDMTDGEFRKWAGTFYPGHPTTHPMCQSSGINPVN